MERAVPTPFAGRPRLRTKGAHKGSPPPFLQPPLVRERDARMRVHGPPPLHRGYAKVRPPFPPAFGPAHARTGLANGIPWTPPPFVRPLPPFFIFLFCHPPSAPLPTKVVCKVCLPLPSHHVCQHHHPLCLMPRPQQGKKWKGDKAA